MFKKFANKMPIAQIIWFLFIIHGSGMWERVLQKNSHNLKMSQ